LAVAVSSAPAGAQTPPPPDDIASLAQYFEQIPTGTGSKVVNPRERGRVKLRRAVMSAIESKGGREAPLLADVATSSAFGAPQESLAPKRTRESEKPRRGVERRPLDVTDPSPLSAALDAAEGVSPAASSPWRTLALLAILLAATGWAIVAAWRRRSRRGS
jgi:hypothetical protein